MSTHIFDHAILSFVEHVDQVVGERVEFFYYVQNSWIISTSAWRMGMWVWFTILVDVRTSYNRDSSTCEQISGVHLGTSVIRDGVLTLGCG